MEILGMIHVLSALLTVVFAVFTLFQVFHRYSLQHRIEAMTAKMKPLILGRSSRDRVMEVMKLDGFSLKEADELYEILENEIEARRNPKQKA